jgi:hypothetical protein
MTKHGARCGAAAVALAVGLIVAVGVPLGERWRDCRAPASEACVWDKALLPVSLGVGVVLGAVVAALVYMAVRAWRQHLSPPDAG